MRYPVAGFFVTLLFATVRAFAAATAALASEPPREWIDPATGHRIVRLSDEPGTASLYFHQNAYSRDGKKLVVTTPHGISTITLANRAIDEVVSGKVNVIVVGRKSGDVYYSRRGEDGLRIFATNLDTKATREIGKVPRGGVSSLNADETLLLGSYAGVDEPADRWRRAPGRGEAEPTAPAQAARPRGPGRTRRFKRSTTSSGPTARPPPLRNRRRLRCMKRSHASTASRRARCLR